MADLSAPHIRDDAIQHRLLLGQEKPARQRPVPGCLRSPSIHANTDHGIIPFWLGNLLG
jgi:hypothetical protein